MMMVIKKISFAAILAFQFGYGYEQKRLFIFAGIGGGIAMTKLDHFQTKDDNGNYLEPVKNKNNAVINFYVGSDFLFKKNFITGIEFGLFNSNVSAVSKTIANKKYSISTSYNELPNILLRFKYLTQHNLNYFLKTGVAYSEITENVDIKTDGGDHTRYKVNNHYIFPKLVIGLEYEIKNSFDIYLSYSYIHGNSKISSFKAIGLGVEFKLPI